ncbi:hypothetical protein NUACC26_010590 [Scytonema sp. NUACC26]
MIENLDNDCDTSSYLSAVKVMAEKALMEVEVVIKVWLLGC